VGWACRLYDECMFNTLLVPLDGSQAAESALDYARCLATDHHSEIILVRARESTLNYGLTLDAKVMQHILDGELHQVEVYLQEMQEKLAAGGFRVSTETWDKPAAEMILALARTRNVDLILMSSHGRSGVERFFLGSTAERVTRHASCPVMIVGRASLPLHCEPVASLTGDHPVERTLAGSIPL
jgi:nucleotide-binding universal stress UspA family protein